MLTKKKVFDKIVEELTPFLYDFGFSYIKSQKYFVHKFKGGFHSVVVTVYDYQPQFMAKITAQLRVDIVEDIVNKFNQAYRSRDVVKTSITDAISFKSLTGLEQIENIYTEDDILAATNLMKSALKEKGFNYLETHSNIQNLYNKIKSWINIESEYIETDARTALYILTLAKLCNDKNYPGFVNTFTKKAKYLPEDDVDALPSVRALIEYLETVQPIKS